MRRKQTGISWPQVLILLCLLLGGAWVWWTYAPETLPEALRAPRPAPAAVAPPLYKWKDQSGQWHISDQPPAGRAYETVIVDPNTNVLPSGVAPEAD